MPKPWSGDKSILRRRTATREERRRLLIVCEGKKTEPNYFRSFRVPKAVLQIEPAERQHLQVVRYAITKRDESPDDFDEVWCVFDRDKDPTKRNDTRDFNDAIALADRENIRVAYSNDAFELWYVLHFEYLNTAISRRDYVRKLRSQMPGGFTKGDPKNFAKLSPHMADAIQRAKTLLEEYPTPNPVDDDPSTTVHLLVLELLKYG